MFFMEAAFPDFVELLAMFAPGAMLPRARAGSEARKGRGLRRVGYLLLAVAMIYLVIPLAAG